MNDEDTKHIEHILATARRLTATNSEMGSPVVSEPRNEEAVVHNSSNSLWDTALNRMDAYLERL